MKVRTQAFITAPDGSYAYYPDQILVDHEHAPDWVARGLAIEIDKPERAVKSKEETADQPAGEISGPEDSETSQRQQRKRK